MTAPMKLKAFARYVLMSFPEPGRAEALDDDDRAAAADGAHGRVGLRVDVKQRQARVEPRAALEAEPPRVRLAGEDVGAVRLLHDLRVACRPGGEDEADRVPRLERRSLEGAVRRGGTGSELGQRHRLHHRRRADCAEVAPVCERQLRRRPSDRVGHLDRLPARIEPDEDGADLGEPEPGDDEVGGVLEHEGDTVALAHAELLPRGGRAIDPAVELLVRDLLLVRDQRRRSRIARDRLLEEVAHVQAAHPRGQRWQQVDGRGGCEAGRVG